MAVWTTVENTVWQNQWKPSLVVVIGSGPTYNPIFDPFRLGKHAQFFVNSEPYTTVNTWQVSPVGNNAFTDPRQWATNYRFFSETNPPWDNPWKSTPRTVTDFLQSSDIFASHDTFGWPEYPYPPFWVNEGRGAFNTLQSITAYPFANDVWMLKKQDKFVAPEQVYWTTQPPSPQSLQPYVPYLKTLQQPSAKVFLETNPPFIDFSQRPISLVVLNAFTAYNPATDPTLLKPPTRFFQDPDVIWGPQPITQNALFNLPPAYNPATDPILRRGSARFDIIVPDIYDNPYRFSQIVINGTGVIPPPITGPTTVLNWQGRVVLSTKRVGESLFVPMDFISRLAAGETILSATASISVFSGSDPNVGTMLIGSPIVSGTVVEQQIGTGVTGVTYDISIQILTSLSQTLELDGYFVVVPPLP